MQSGKILPPLRQFFTTLKTGNATRDSNSQQGQNREPEKEASAEEAELAAKALADSEEFQKNFLSTEVTQQQDKPVILVKSSSGAVVRVIKNSEIHVILQSLGSAKGPRHGRILDRRI